MELWRGKYSKTVSRFTFKLYFKFIELTLYKYHETNGLSSEQFPLFYTIHWILIFVSSQLPRSQSQHGMESDCHQPVGGATMTENLLLVRTKTAEQRYYCCLNPGNVRLAGYIYSPSQIMFILDSVNNGQWPTIWLRQQK